MNIYIRRSCLSFVLLTALIEAIQANKTESNSEGRQGRVNGRIVKLYSGSKPEPIICLDEGFKADPVDCSVFYRCVKTSKEKYNIFRYQCGPGTVYDPENEVCNHPRNTKRSECGGLIPLSHDANEENEIEDHELPSPITTKLPVYSSYLELSNATLVTRTTVEPQQLNLNSKTTTTRSVPLMTTNKYEVSLPAYPWTESKNDKNQMSYLTTISPTSDKSSPCIADGFIGDTENCRKFYRCVRNSRGSFTRYEYLCSEATIWDDNIKSCNHVWAARNSRCGQNDYHSHYNKKPFSDVTSEKEPQVNYASTSTNDMLEQNNVEYGSKVNIDKIEGNHTQEYNKQSAHWPQYEANHASGESLVNAEYGSKDKKTTVVYKSTQWPQNEANYASRESQINAEYGSKDRKTTIVYSTEEPHLNKTTLPSDTGKSKQCLQSGFMGDPNDCSRFYRCVDNGRGSFTKYEFTCSQGTVWDSRAEACNHAWAVQECGGSSSNKDISPTIGPIEYETSLTATSSSSVSTTSSSNYHSSRLPSQTTTTTKYPTSSTTSDIAENNNNSYFNEIEEETQEKVTTRTTVLLISSTTSSRPSLKECEETGFFGDQNDCQIFYRCVNNEKGAFTKYEYRCGEGTLWDQDLQACNHAWAVKSCGQQSVTNVHETTKTNDIVTTSPYNQTTTLGYVPNNDYNNSEYNTPLPIETTKSDATVTQNTPKQPMTQENVCQDTGFIGDYNNCKVFYRCVDNGNGGFIQHEFICGEGTAWDPNIEACNHASAVKRCGGTKDIEEEIQSNTQTNIDNLNNGYTSQNYNSQSTISSSQIPTSDTTNIDNDNLNNGYTTLNYNSQSTMSSSQIPTISSPTTSSLNECNTNGFVGDKNDCKKFYRCVESETGVYERYEFFCGDGTLWDPKIQACNHATEVKECNSIASTEQKDNVTEIYVKPTTSSIDENENGYITQNNNQPVYSSPSTTVRSPTLTTLAARNETNKCESSGFIGDENDCQKFYRCVDDGNGDFIMYEFTCSEGTAWDSKITACNHAWAVEKCGKNQNELMETTSHSVQAVNTTTQQTTVSTIDSSQATSQTQISHTPVVASTSPTSKPNESSAKEQKCNSEGYFANENDCRKFFRCVYNGKDGYTKYEFDCGEGTVWVQEIQACDHDTHVANCTSSATVITTSTGSYEESSSATSSIDKSNTTSSATSSSQSSTLSSTTTDKPSTTTSIPVESKPTSEQTGQTYCENEGYFGNTEDCKKFYRCVSNGKGGYTKYDYTCGEGTIWDNDIVACNHPQDVTNPSCKSDHENTSSKPQQTTTDKDSGYITSSPGSTLESLTTTSESSSSTSNVGNGTNTNCTDNNSIESSSGQNITCQKAGYYADPYDCKKFHRCVDWDGNGEKFSVFHFECSDGTIWDPALETCNHKDSVYPPRDCSGDQQQSQNVTESATTTAITTTSESPQTTQTLTTKETTPQMTTSEQSTTQSSTSEQSTTQLSTSEQSTTQSTTSEQSTTQSSTSEQSTTQSSTSEQSTTQSSTSEQSTTQSSTSEQSTTQSSTTEQSTIQSSTTEQSTTQSSTTEQPTTQSSTSEQSTTQSSTTEQSTTQLTTSEQSTQSTSTDQTTTPSNQEQTTKSSTEQTDMTESTTETTHLTSMSTDQTTTEQVTSSTEKSTTTEDNISQITEVQSTTTESTTTESDKVSSTESTTSNQECPETDGDQFLFVCPTSFRRHPKYCNLFYQCIEDNDSHEVKVAVFNCPNNTIYDETKVQCVEEEKSDKKCNGQMAQKHRVKRLGAFFNEPILVTEESMACSSVGHFPFEINEVCSEAFLKCELTQTGKLRSYVYKCPEGFVYWKISRRCEPIRKVKDCKRSSYPWKRRYDLPLETYNIGS
ncbi:unnamed protein product, partial [Brenthis ino]